MHESFPIGKVWHAKLVLASRSYVGGEMYVMNLIDDNIINVSLYFLEKRAYAFEFFKEWKDLVEK
jgi:hypothetical protein